MSPLLVQRGMLSKPLIHDRIHIKGMIAKKYQNYLHYLFCISFKDEVQERRLSQTADQRVLKAQPILKFETRVTALIVEIENHL